MLGLWKLRAGHGASPAVDPSPSATTPASAPCLRPQHRSHVCSLLSSPLRPQGLCTTAPLPGAAALRSDGSLPTLPGLCSHRTFAGTRTGAFPAAQAAQWDRGHIVLVAVSRLPLEGDPPTGGDWTSPPPTKATAPSPAAGTRLVLFSARCRGVPSRAWGAEQGHGGPSRGVSGCRRMSGGAW